jgi:hypothetical protein
MPFEFIMASVVEAGVAIVKMARPPVNANRAMYMEPADIFSNPDQLESSERAIGLPPKATSSAREMI